MNARLACLSTLLLLAAARANAQLPPIAPPDLSPPGDIGQFDPLAPPSSLTLSNTRSLDFGRFVAGSGGTITIGPSGARSRTGGVVLLSSPSAGNAAFTVSRTGKPVDKSVILSFPVNGSVTLSNGAQTMTVQNFVNGSGNLLPPGLGNSPLAIGASLNVAPNQARGQYSGSFNLTVNYQ